MSDTSESADDAGRRPTGGDDAAAAVDAEKVRHVADLARVRLDDDEVEAFADQFGDILDFEEALDGARDRPRGGTRQRDAPRRGQRGLTQEEALSNAEETEDGFFVGPKVS